MNNVTVRLTNKLNLIREDVGRPVILNSASRCAKHNEAVGGSLNSAHLSGLAADIKVHGSKERWQVVRKAIAYGITRIGIADTFVHVDVDDSKTQNVIWTY